MPHFNHEHHFDQGTIGYAAETLADGTAAAWDAVGDFMSRMTSRRTGDRRSSETEDSNPGAHKTGNRDAIKRAKRALGRVVSRDKGVGETRPTLNKVQGSTSDGISIGIVPT